MALTPEDEATLDKLEEAASQYEEYVRLSEIALQEAILDSPSESDAGASEFLYYESAPLGLVLD